MSEIDNAARLIDIKSAAAYIRAFSPYGLYDGQPAEDSLCEGRAGWWFDLVLLDAWIKQKPLCQCVIVHWPV